MKKIVAILLLLFISVLSLTSCDFFKSESSSSLKKIAETFPTNEEGIISKEDMRALILKYSNKEDHNVKFDKFFFDIEDGREIYKIALLTDTNAYTYTVDAKTGEIISENSQSIDSYYGI